jgi:hypothetical protein
VDVATADDQEATTWSAVPCTTRVGRWLGRAISAGGKPRTRPSGSGPEDGREVLPGAHVQPVVLHGHVQPVVLHGVEGLGYWSGMRRAKNSTSSDAAGGSRLLRLTTT